MSLMLLAGLVLAGCSHTAVKSVKPEVADLRAPTPSPGFVIPVAWTGTSLEAGSASENDFFLQMESELDAELDLLDAPVEEF